MLLWENILLAINSLLSNKMRAFLTMLGIIIGIGAVIAIITVGDSLTLSVSENMQSAGANDIYVIVQEKNSDDKEEGNIDGIIYGSSNTNTSMSDEDLISSEMINSLCNQFPDEIYAINLQNSIGTTSIELGKNSANVNLSGVTAGYFVTNDLEILAGHMFSKEDFEEGKNVILVSDKFVEKVFDGDNKKAIGSEIEINYENAMGVFSIVGVYKYEENYMMGMPMGGETTDLYMPLKTSKNFTHQDNNYMFFEIITKIGVNSDEFSAKIKSFFEPYYRNNKNFEVTAMTLTSMVSMLTDMLSTITLAIAVIAGIALVVGGIGVMNIMLVSITERTREIGTRKALGAKNSSIRIQFIVEAMIICLIGGFFGVVLGVGAGMGLSNVLGYPAKPSISGIIISLLFSMSIGVFFGYYPANKAAKMNPIDSLRYE